MEIYFDNAATTPLLPQVQAALQERFATYGNPSSLHRKGVEAEQVLTKARQALRRALGVEGGRIVFTGCGTEGNNLAILGTARKLKNRGQHIVTTAIEHPSVLETCRALERDGWQVTYIKPCPDGMVRAADVLSAVRDDTVLVSVMHVNNETGAWLPVEEIGEALAANPKVRFHVDGVQAFGKLPQPARAARADLYTVSGHKLGAPKGVGALYVRDGVELEPVLYGGGQEFGLRSGTQNVLGIDAFATAVEVLCDDVEGAFAHVEKLTARLLEGLEATPGCSVQRPERSSPYIVNVSFPGLRGEVMVHAFESAGLYVSTGSACSTKGGQSSPSHVLQAMGRNEPEVTGAIRISLTRWHTEADVDAALKVIREQTAWLRSIL
jgi:cysteine desulfurase